MKNDIEDSDGLDSLLVGSLFSGIGGIDLGLERAGMEIRWQVEIDSFCLEVLEKHWPNVYRWPDIKRAGAWNLEDVDLIAGGFPCQDISEARSVVEDGEWVHGGDGLDGSRSGLWFEFARIIYEMKPRYVLIENVRALRFRGGGLGILLKDLASFGYDAEWHALPASAFGFPHIRDRTFIVAYSEDVRREYSKYAEGEICPPIIRWPLPVKGADVGRERESFRREICSTKFIRKIDGISDRMDRIKALGNAVIPQISEWLGHQILRHHVIQELVGGG